MDVHLFLFTNLFNGCAFFLGLCFQVELDIFGGPSVKSSSSFQSQFTLFLGVYDFGPKSCNQSFFDIICNPVPGIEFRGRLGEEDNFRTLD